MTRKSRSREMMRERERVARGKERDGKREGRKKERGDSILPGTVVRVQKSTPSSGPHTISISVVDTSRTAISFTAKEAGKLFLRKKKKIKRDKKRNKA